MDQRNKVDINGLDKMIEYLFNNDISQVEFTVTKIAENDQMFCIKTIKPSGPKYITVDSMGYSLKECQEDYLRRVKI